MILIGVYATSIPRIYVGAFGAQRDNSVRFSYTATKETTFQDVRIVIYRHLRILERQYSLRISARYSSFIGIARHVYVIPVNSETEWRMIYHMAISEMNSRIIELLVDVLPNETTGNVNLLLNARPGTSSSFRDDLSVSDSTLSSPEPVVMRSPIRNNIEIGGDINSENEEAVEEQDSDSVDDDDPRYQPNYNSGRRLVVTRSSERQHKVPSSSRKKLRSNVGTRDDFGDVSGPHRIKCRGSQSARHSISVPPRPMNAPIDTFPGAPSSQGFQPARYSFSAPPAITDARSRTKQGALADQPLRKSLGGRIRSFLRVFSSRGRS